MPAAAAPAKARAASSEGQSAAVAVIEFAAANVRSDETSTRLLPTRSENRANNGALSAYVIENIATDHPAIAVDRPKSTAMSGSKGDMTKSSVPTRNIVNQAVANWGVAAIR